MDNMAKRVKGKCKYCGKEYTMSYMNKHLATYTECVWDGGGFLCEDCSETHECGEDMLLDVCNSPRMGVCAYMGSDIYPDQFIPDTEQTK